MKALIVDDEKLVADVVSSFLAKKGITADIAYDLQEGMDKFNSSYDLVLLDIQLKNEQSFSLLEKIKKEKPCTVVVMFSGYDSEEYIHKAKSFGADGFIPKPFKVEYLAEYLLPKVEALIAKSKKTCK